MITIIVLLILAGVALAVLTGNTSIIDNANYAVEEYNKTANGDQNVLDKVEGLFAKYMGDSDGVYVVSEDKDDGLIINLEITADDASTYKKGTVKVEGLEFSIISVLEKELVFSAYGPRMPL